MFGWLGPRSDSVDSIDVTRTHPGDVQPCVLKKRNIASVTDRDRLWSGLLAGFANNVSVVGLKYFVDANVYSLRRLLWLVLVLTGVGVLFYQMTDRVQYYFTYPSTVKTKLRYVSSLPLPAITVCNENAIKKSEAEKMGLVDDVEKIYFHDFNPFPEETVNGSITNWTDVFSVLAPQTVETIQRCQVSGNECEEEAWTRKIRDIGYCFSFNLEGKNYSVVQEGIRGGLEVLLFANSTEYLGASSASSGFRILLHDKNEYPLMYDKSMKAPTNNLVLLSVTMRKIRDLGPPYSECVDIPGYTEINCKMDCFKARMYNVCGCIAPYVEECDNYDIGNETKCDMYQQHNCIRKLRENFIKGGLNSTTSTGCNCPRECCKTQYQAVLTHSSVHDHFFDYLGKEMMVPAWVFYNNYTLLNIYYNDMYYEEVTTEPSYPLPALLSDIGGAFGLILGSTILTVIEFVDFFVRVVTAMCAQEHTRRNKLLPQPTMVRPITALHR